MQIIVEEAYITRREGRYGAFLSLDVIADGNKYTVMKGNIARFKDKDKEEVCKGSILYGEVKDGKYKQFLVDNIVNPVHKNGEKSPQDKLVKVRNQALELLNSIEALL